MAIKYEKKYQCKYCDYRDIKSKLITHIETDHQDMLPKGFTPTRVVFNIVNKREVGSCKIDGKPTKWNEARFRYNPFCSDKCRDEYIKLAKERMINKYGKAHLLNDMEQQKIMLANRPISGSYKFSDGGIRSYCGSYERKCLEFLDKVMGFHSDEIITGGPIFEYDFKNQKHNWIMDIFIIPFNLLIDCKDGGSNKNTNEALKEYREKQIAKEKMIVELKEYNYLRLTDNDFSQLLFALSEIKLNLQENNDKLSININEYMSMASVHSSVHSNNLYLIPYSDSGLTIDGYAISKNELIKNMFITDVETGMIEAVEFDFLQNKYYTVYEYTGDDVKDKYKTILENCKNKTVVDHDHFYTIITGDKLEDLEQIDNDSRFIKKYISTDTDNSTYMERYIEEVNHFVDNELSINKKLIQESNDILESIKKTVNEEEYEDTIKEYTILSGFGRILHEYQVQEKEPIYIVLTKSNSLMSRQISRFTKDHYTHSSISFDLEMKKMYSFNTTGFVTEDLKQFKNKFGNIDIGIYCIFLDKEDINKIKWKLDEILATKSIYKYNTIGLFGILLNIPIQIKDTMFCSEFVAKLLSFSKLNIVDKATALTRPEDFKNSQLVYKIYEGSIDNYDGYKAEKLVRKL